ncbi:MAG: hypothetical protein A4E53_03518 [Pelotomaculum sp. PtaB.Bin104]|nr:MAG: hypothetical protein A4E53_03518 [Pelotomaculum sp. PtaB.Bin104]
MNDQWVILDFCEQNTARLLKLEDLYRWRYIREHNPGATLWAIAEGLAEWEEIYKPKVNEEVR